MSSWVVLWRDVLNKIYSRESASLKVQFPLWHNTAIDRGADRIKPLAEFEIEMLKSKRTNHWKLKRENFSPIWKQFSVFICHIFEHFSPASVPTFTF